MSIGALFKLARKWKQSKCPPFGKWRNTMWCIHTLKYYLAIKRNKLLVRVTTWLNLKSIMVSEQRQIQKTKQQKQNTHILNYSVCMTYSEKANLHRMKINDYLCWGGSGDWLQMGTGDLFQVIERFCICIMVMVAQLYAFTKSCWLTHLPQAYFMVGKVFSNKTPKTVLKRFLKGENTVYEMLLRDMIRRLSKGHVGH